jgi:hypothetical protein
VSKEAAIDAAAAAIMVRADGPIVLRQFAAAIVEAAAPHLQESAWDEGFKQGGPMHDEHYGEPDKHTINPYRSQQ